jgi:hypothetical protein
LFFFDDFIHLLITIVHCSCGGDLTLIDRLKMALLNKLVDPSRGAW